ncbi:MAG: hypothetical protein IPJ88_17505 [Myxococcales bacterium]|nr:MAG: hypothetical protein IPJ88_17505 [Myxococcales bacterium]
MHTVVYLGAHKEDPLVLGRLSGAHVLNGGGVQVKGHAGPGSAQYLFHFFESLPEVLAFLREEQPLALLVDTRHMPAQPWSDSLAAHFIRAVESWPRLRSRIYGIVAAGSEGAAAAFELGKECSRCMGRA